jgi:hypothetical protein
VPSWDLQNFELTKAHLLSHKMNVKLHMLRSAMVHWIFRQVNRRDIVTVDYRGLVDAHMKFAKQIPEPTALRGSIGHSPVFGLCAGQGYRRLALR